MDVLWWRVLLVVTNVVGDAVEGELVSVVPMARPLDVAIPLDDGVGTEYE